MHSPKKYEQHKKCQKTPTLKLVKGDHCRRAFKFDHLCALNFDQA